MYMCTLQHYEGGRNSTRKSDREVRETRRFKHKKERYKNGFLKSDVSLASYLLIQPLILSRRLRLGN